MSARRSAVLHGARAASPFVIVAVPFALLFGVVATEAGLNLAEVMGLSVLVVAGASQFAAVQLIAEEAPTLIVLATGLAVNLRMAMYSAALVPHLGAAPLGTRAAMAYLLTDQTYAAAAAEFEARPGRPLAERIAFFFGTMIPVVPPWVLFTWLGARLGQAIPPEYALDFAVPITFLAIVAPMLRTPAHVAAAAMSILLALLFAWVPYSGGLLVASAGAMLTGAQVEVWTTGRAGHGG